jgi:hypothetical protein
VRAVTEGCRYFRILEIIGPGARLASAPPI